MIFIDTSAFISILDMDDDNHERSGKIWKDLVLSGECLICTNYILVETISLLQSRFGIKGVRNFQGNIVPIMVIEWVDSFTHELATTGLLSANRKELSFVDCISFTVMRKLSITSAFAFDHHFKEQGFFSVVD